MSKIIAIIISIFSINIASSQNYCNIVNNIFSLELTETTMFYDKSKQNYTFYNNTSYDLSCIKNIIYQGIKLNNE